MPYLIMTFFKSHYKSIIWAVFIVILLFTPGNKIPHPGILNFPNSDKLVHLILFTVLACLMLFETERTYRNIYFRQIIGITVIILFFGAFTELAQEYFTKDREGSIYDFLADLAGIALATSIHFILRKTISRWFHPIS